MKAFSVALLLVAAGLSLPAHATKPSFPIYQISDLRLAAAVSADRPTAIFFTIKNTGPIPGSLISVDTPLCGRTELHDHMHENGVMKMRQVPQVDIPAGESVTFKPMGLHVMCFDPVLPHTPGTDFDMTFHFSDGGLAHASGRVVPLAESIRGKEPAPDHATH